MILEELIKTDEFKSLKIRDQIFLIINKTPIDKGDGHFVWIGSPKSGEMAERITDILKEYKNDIENLISYASGNDQMDDEENNHLSQIRDRMKALGLYEN